MTVTYLIQYLKYKDGDLEQNFWVSLSEFKWVFFKLCSQWWSLKKNWLLQFESSLRTTYLNSDIWPLEH